MSDRASRAAGKAGRVALVGRPNAGKSTLMNRFLAEKLAIVSDKPQTTRHRLVGILSEGSGQMVFYDTPGVHRPEHRLNREMVRRAVDALNDAEVICLLVDVSQPFGGGDRYMLDLMARSDLPKVLALNKVDLVADKRSLLPRIARYAEGDLFREIVPTSALTGDGAELLLDLLWELLPAGEPFYDPELLTIHPERFLVAERIREKVLEATRDEIPFSTAVVVEQWEERPGKGKKPGAVVIHAQILVERPGQKGIVVGRAGRQIREIGRAARLDLEAYLERPVYLELHVRHEPGWRESRRILARMDRDVSGLG